MDAVRMEEVPVRFVYRDIDDYVRRARDTGGAFAKVFREVSEDEREAMTAQLEEAFAPFATAGGYELSGVALAAGTSGRRSSSRPASARPAA